MAYSKAYQMRWNDFRDNVTIQAMFYPKSALVSGQVYGDWVYIDYNSGADRHYFLFFDSNQGSFAGYYDALVQITPPYPSTYSASDLLFVAGNTTDFDAYISANYPNIVGGVQITGAIVAIEGITTTTAVISLKPGPTPCDISYVDNDETKTNPIRAKKAVFQFISNTLIDFTTFAVGEDDEWLVEVHNLDVAGNPDELIFKGFLIMDDHNSPFLPHPKIITLTATDNLATLKTVPLVDIDTGKNPLGSFSLIEYCSWCLKKTGLDLNINVICGLSHKSNGSITTSAQFFNAFSQIVIPLNDTTRTFVTAGKQIIITDTVNNNGVYTIDSFILSFQSITLFISESLVDEIVVAATFTDSGIFGLYLDAKTFEENVGVSEDCYTVLQKICTAFNCFLSFHAGEWYIQSWDELRFPDRRIIKFSPDGNLLSIETTSLNYEKRIGKGQQIFPRDAAGLVHIRRPQGSVTQRYDFATPLEIPCNMDFSRGTDFISDLPDERYNLDGNLITDPNDFATTDKIYQVKKYAVDCWVIRQGSFGFPPTVQGYIKKLFLDGYEKERYLVIEPYAWTGTFFADATHVNYFLSQAIPVDALDKINVGVDWKWDYDNGYWNNNIHDLTEPVFMVWLLGNDGSNWWLDMDSPINEKGVWIQADPPQFGSVRWNGNVNGLDETKIRSIKSESPPIPVSGDIRILLPNHGWANQGVDGKYLAYGNVLYTNLSVEYIPNINGSYQKYTGQEHKFEQDLNYKNKTVTQVYISDGLKKLFKGALLTINGYGYDLANEFYSLRDGVANGFQIDTLGKYTTNALWNQYRNGWRVFDFNLQGLETSGTTCLSYLVTNQIPGPPVKYQYTSCDGTDVDESLAYNTSVTICAQSRPVTDNLVQELGLCCTAYRIRNEVPGPPVSYQYTDCDGVDVDESLAFGTEKIVCASSTITTTNIVTQLGPCVAVDTPDLLHRYVIKDESYQSTNRVFMVIGMQEQNFKELKWQATVGEVYATKNGYLFDDGINVWHFNYVK